MPHAQAAFGLSYVADHIGLRPLFARLDMLPGLFFNHQSACASTFFAPVDVLLWLRAFRIMRATQAKGI